MIPKLFPADTTSYLTNGLGRLPDAVSCIVTEERNGGYELEMQYPITGLHYSDIAVSCIIYAVPADGKTEQPFRIYKITRPLNGIVTVFAEHISYQLSHIPVMPFSASSAAQAMVDLKAYAAEDCPFEFWTDKEVESSLTVKAPQSIRSKLGGEAGSVLDVYGGEYEWDNYAVKLWVNRGSDRGVTLRYGKNITDIQQEENLENVITGIVPYWADTESETVMTLPEVTVQSAYADVFPYRRTVPVDFSQAWQEQPTEAQLRAKAIKYVEDNALGVPKVSIDVDFVPLWQATEYNTPNSSTLQVLDGDLAVQQGDLLIEVYSNVAPLERVQLCDTVTVYFEKLGISAKAKVIKTVYNVLKGRYDSISIGDARTSLADTIAGTAEEIAAAQEETTSALQKAIANATEQITGNKGGYILFQYDADGQPYEMLVMDAPNINDAVHVWRWNQNGWGYSSTGYDGEYTLAATADGAIVADFITAGTLNANIIKAGILSDVAGRNYWNLLTGEFSLQGYATKAEATTVTVIQYATGTSNNTAPVTGWSAATPTWQDGYYIWQRVLTQTADGEVSYSDPVCIQGAKGADGSSVTILGVYNTYDELIAAHPTGSAGDAYLVNGSLYIWAAQETGILAVSTGDLAVSQGDLNIYAADRWSYVGQLKGDQGETGATGLGVSSIVPQYYLSISDSTLSGGTWTAAEPIWREGYYIWTRSYITWSDGTTATTTPTLAKALNSANETATTAQETAEDAAQAVADLDEELDSTGVFNRLTDNGTIEGIFLRDGNLYINGSYIATGILTDTAGNNYWNLDTGVLHISGYSTTSEVTQLVSGSADETLAAAKSYTDQMDVGNATFRQATIPASAVEGDIWYITGSNTLYYQQNLSVRQGDLTVSGDQLIIAQALLPNRLYRFDGEMWIMLEDGALADYSTTTEMRNEISATAESLTLAYQTYVDGNLTQYSTIEQTSERIETVVADYESADEALSSSITQLKDSISLSVTNGEKTASLTLSLGTGEDQVTREATINMTGLVTFTDLSTSGNTTINGANIQTGTIKAAQIATGTITATQIASNTITASEIAANAINTSELAASAVTAAKIASSAITADKIASGAVTTSKLDLTGMLTIYNGSSKTAYASIGYGTGYDGSSTTYGAKMAASGGSNYVIVTNAGARMTAGGHSIYVTSSTAYVSGPLGVSGGITSSTIRSSGSVLVLGPSNTGYGVRVTAGTFTPYSGSTDLGSSSYKWGNIYASTSTITVSDRRQKTDISGDMTKYLTLFDDLKPSSFKFIDGTSGRRHLGFIAQDVEASITRAGLTTKDFAGFVIGENGDYGLRYSEFIAILTAKIKQLETRIAELEEAA